MLKAPDRQLLTADRCTRAVRLLWPDGWTGPVEGEAWVLTGWAEGWPFLVHRPCPVVLEPGPLPGDVG